ncbi:MAG TPA: hypothetical protein VKT52_03600 [Ktedonobacterales bacterium]|nr:hypothetical protein [Ktedonobacterales bacterium]
MMSMFLAAVAVALVVSAVGCLIALRLFPWFRSGERKEGHFRPDQSTTGSFRVDSRKGVLRIRSARPGSSELPLVGGPAIILGIIAAAIVAGVILNLNSDQWTLLAVLLAATLGFAAVGFVDDWRKVHQGEGISEIQKGIGVILVSLAAAIALNRFVITPHLSARLAYPPYSDIPGLGHLLINQKFAWIVFFLLMTVTVASSTSLAVDFADGMDGLCGGLMLSAALSFAAILLGEGEKELWPAAIAVLAIAGAVGGYLPFNWPSSWRARSQGWGRRRAKLIMGDTGSLALGGLLALVAIISRQEFVLIFIGGVFVLEGVSALVSARILVKFFRRYLVLERYGGKRGFAHTEMPLPFLATPLHHHFDLLSVDRKRLVYGAWLLGAGLGVLGVASQIGTFTWERYLARFVAFLIIIAVWQSGPWTKSFFIGLVRSYGAPEEQPRNLALFYGFPFRLFGRPLYSRIDTTDTTEADLRSPAEKLSLWQRMSVFDARSVLGYYCYRVGSFQDALRIWSRIPTVNLEKRPDIAEMLAEVRQTIAMQVVDEELAEPEQERADQPQPRDGWTADPNATMAAQVPIPPVGGASGVRQTQPPSSARLAAMHLEPADEAPPDVLPGQQSAAPLWTPGTYSSWMAGQPAVPAADASAAPEPQETLPMTPASPEDDQPAISITPVAEPVPESSGSRNVPPRSHP